MYHFISGYTAKVSFTLYTLCATLTACTFLTAMLHVILLFISADLHFLLSASAHYDDPNQFFCRISLQSNHPSNILYGLK